MKSAFSGTFKNLKTLADGTPRIVIDLDCTLAEAVQLHLSPGAPLAVARLTQEAAKEAMVEEVLKGGPLSREAAGLSKNDDFFRWAVRSTGFHNPEGKTEEELCADYIRQVCAVSSRVELDHDEGAARRFQTLKRLFLLRNEA